MNVTTGQTAACNVACHRRASSRACTTPDGPTCTSQGDETEPPPRATVRGASGRRLPGPSAAGLRQHGRQDPDRSRVRAPPRQRLRHALVHPRRPACPAVAQLSQLPFSPPSPPPMGNAHLTRPTDAPLGLQHARRHLGAQRTRRSVSDLAVVETDGSPEQVDSLTGPSTAPRPRERHRPRRLCQEIRKRESRSSKALPWDPGQSPGTDSGKGNRGRVEAERMPRTLLKTRQCTKSDRRTHPTVHGERESVTSIPAELPYRGSHRPAVGVV